MRVSLFAQSFFLIYLDATIEFRAAERLGHETRGILNNTYDQSLKDFISQIKRSGCQLFMMTNQSRSMAPHALGRHRPQSAGSMG
jgi:hypothetical protein